MLKLKLTSYFSFSSFFLELLFLVKQSSVKSTWTTSSTFHCGSGDLPNRCEFLLTLFSIEFYQWFWFFVVVWLMMSRKNVLRWIRVWILFVHFYLRRPPVYVHESVTPLPPPVKRYHSARWTIWWSAILLVLTFSTRRQTSHPTHWIIRGAILPQR